MTSFQFPPLQFLLENFRKYGDIFTFRVGSRRFYFINNSDYIKEVLTTNQSAFFKEEFLKRTTKKKRRRWVLPSARFTRSLI